jgi:hypothetical protein
MELKDVSGMHIPAAPAVQPGFAEEFPESGRRYALRQPNSRPYVAAGIVSAFWIGAAAAFVLGYLGIEGFLALDWPWLAGLFFAVAFPVAFTWFAAHMSRRARGLQLASEDLLQIAARLIEPDTSAGREITRLGRAVRREIDALNSGLEGALARVRSLESAITERLRAVEDTSRNLEERGDAIRAALRDERENLTSFAAALVNEAERIGESVRARGVSLKDLARQTAADVAAAQDTLDVRAAALQAALDQATTTAYANAQTADRGAAALISAAEALDGRLDGFLQRGERQRAALGEAVNALKAETQALEATLGRNLDALGGLGQALAEQTRRTDAVATDIARRGEAAAGGLGARADAIAAAFAAQMDKLDSSANAAEERLKTTTAAASDAAEKVRATFEMAALGAQSASQQTGEMTASSMAALAAALEALTSRTEDARSAAAQAIAELKAEAEALPALIAERIKEIRAAELAALPAPEPVPQLTATRDPRPDDQPHSPDGRPEWFGFARKLAGFIRREPDAGGPSDWRLSTALANVDDRPPAPRRDDSKSNSADLHREALYVVEKLQALAIDLDRALGDDPAPDLWRRYVSGERSVFTRRLISSIGREGADKIAQRYAADTEFRLHADRYMTEFEALLDDAAARDRDQILVETFLTSQTGRLYLLIAAATGRL